MNNMYWIKYGYVVEIVNGWGESKEHKLRLMNGLLCEGQEIIIGGTLVLLWGSYATEQAFVKGTSHFFL